MQSDAILIESKAVEPFFKNGYILACTSTSHAAYIDPGDEAKHLLKFVDENELELISILNTHAHMDHICGIGSVKQVWDVPIYLHQKDEFLYQGLQEQSRVFGFDYAPAPPIDYYLHPSKQLSVGELTVKIHHTPGHSPGSVSLEVEEHLFCGDVIFAGSIGRTDLPGGSYETLMGTIQKKILPMGDAKILHPGHGPETTVGRERATNPFLRQMEA